MFILYNTDMVLDTTDLVIEDISHIPPSKYIHLINLKLGTDYSEEVSDNYCVLLKKTEKNNSIILNVFKKGTNLYKQVKLKSPHDVYFAYPSVYIQENPNKVTIHITLYCKHYYGEDRDGDLECRVELDDKLNITYISNFMEALY